MRKSAPFSTMCVAQEWRSICGEAARPEAADAARTICQMRWRVSLRPPRAMNSRGEFLLTERQLPTVTLRFPAARPGRACAKYSVQSVLRRFPQRNYALFIAFAAHQHVPGFELQIFQFGVDDFRHPQRAGVENFQHGAIAHSQRG